MHSVDLHVVIVENKLCNQSSLRGVGVVGVDWGAWGWDEEKMFTSCYLSFRFIAELLID